MNTTITFTVESKEAMKLYEILREYGVKHIELKDESIPEPQQELLLKRLAEVHQGKYKTHNEVKKELDKKWSKSFGTI